MFLDFISEYYQVEFEEFKLKRQESKNHKKSYIYLNDYQSFLYDKNVLSNRKIQQTQLLESIESNKNNLSTSHTNSAQIIEEITELESIELEHQLLFNLNGLIIIINELDLYRKRNIKSPK